jgi:hypothetical protein
VPRPPDDDLVRPRHYRHRDARPATNRDPVDEDRRIGEGLAAALAQHDELSLLGPALGLSGCGKRCEERCYREQCLDSPVHDAPPLETMIDLASSLT